MWLLVLVGQWGLGSVGILGWPCLLSFHIVISRSLFPHGLSVGFPYNDARLLTWGSELLKAQKLKQTGLLKANALLGLVLCSLLVKACHRD